MADRIPFDKSTKAYLIVIEGNEASEYYASAVLPSWHDAGIYPKRFNAITPETQSSVPLRFGLSSASKYTSRGIQKHITPSEKACFSSHFLLWLKCVKLNEPLLVIEHDTFLEYPKLLVDFKDKFFVTYDDSFGCYKIYPELARILVRNSLKEPITVGPMGMVNKTYRRIEEKDKIFKFYVDHQTEGYRKCVTQVKSLKYGNTIDHYEGMDMDYILKEKFSNDINKFNSFKNCYEFITIG